MKIAVYYVGKPKDEHLNAIAADFLGRCTHYARIESREVKPGRGVPWEKMPGARRIALDPAGKAYDSAAFTALVERSEGEGRDLVFLVGAHDGLPAEWRASADLLLSLSPMTFPHELARAMLAEQIYRAFATLRGLPYIR